MTRTVVLQTERLLKSTPTFPALGCPDNAPVHSFNFFLLVVLILQIQAFSTLVSSHYLFVITVKKNWNPNREFALFINTPTTFYRQSHPNEFHYKITNIDLKKNQIPIIIEDILPSLPVRHHILPAQPRPSPWQSLMCLPGWIFSNVSHEAAPSPVQDFQFWCSNATETDKFKSVFQNQY